MGTGLQVLTVVALLGSALNAGIFYTFSSFVMPGFARLTPERGIAAMQAVNITAVRAPFMSVLFGTALLCVVLAIWSLTSIGSPYWLFLLLGAVLYLVGTIGMTIFLHVPLNDALAVIDPAAPDSAAQWADYQSRWNAWNHVRWLTPLAASALFTAAAFAGRVAPTTT